MLSQRPAFSRANPTVQPRKLPWTPFPGEHEGAEAIFLNAGLTPKAFFKLYQEFVVGKGRVALREGARFDEVDIAAQTRDERSPKKKAVRLGDQGDRIKGTSRGQPLQGWPATPRCSGTSGLPLQPAGRGSHSSNQ